MKSKLQKFLSCCLMGLLLLGCVIPAQAEAPQQKKITFMIYLCGTDLETENSQASRFLGELLRAQYNTQEINVIALAGGTRKWSTGYSRDQLTVLNVTGRRPQVVDTFPVSSMGEAATLSSFLDYCYQNYPADQFILNLWDHGGGPIYGVTFDELYKDQYGNKDSLSLPELSLALENSPFKEDKLDLFLMHACLMSSAEVAAHVSPYADYLVASQDANYGLNYAWLKGAESRGILDTAKMMVDATFEQDVATATRQNDTIVTNSFALIDLSKVNSLITAMNAYFPMLESNINASSFTKMSSQRRDTTAFGIGESGDSADYELVDLGDFVNQTKDYAPDEAAALLKALDETVIYHRSLHDRCSGLTVYHPFAEKKRFSYNIPVYNALAFSEGYTNYVHRFVAMITGTPLAAWKDLYTTAKAEKDLRTLFHLQLTEEQAAHFGDAVFQALHKQADGSYALTFANNSVRFENNALTSEYSGTALYAVSPDGSRLSPAIAYSVTDGGLYVIRASLSRNATEETEACTHDALIYCSYNPETKALIPCHIQVRYDAVGGYTSALQISFEEYDEITLPLEYRKETRNESGTLLPFSEWEIVRTEEWTSAIDGSWGFRMVNDVLDTADLYATFRVCDSQNNFYNSDLKQIKPEVAVDGAVLVTYDDLGYVLIPDFTVSPVQGQLMISLQMQNIHGQEIYFRIENFTVNGQPVEAAAEIFGSGAYWGLVGDETAEALIALPLPAGVSQVTDIQFQLTAVNAAENTDLASIPVHAQMQLTLGQ